MQNEPMDAVLVNIGVAGEPDRWCKRLMSPYSTFSGDNYDLVYAYIDVLTGGQYPPSRCRVIREGRVIVTTNEVK